MSWGSRLGDRNCISKIVDPMKQIVLVYDMENAAAPVIYSFSDLIKANIYEHLDINFSDISELLDI